VRRHPLTLFPRSSAPPPTKTIRRKSSITSGSSTWVISQWNIYNKNTVNGLGAHTVKTTTTAKPCMMVDCMQGWKLVGADKRGCGGTCKKQCPVVRCAAPGPFCKYMKDNKKDADGCLQFPCGIRKCDACVMVKCMQGFDLVGTKTIGDTSGCGGTCKKQCPVVKCAAPLKGCTRQMFPNKKDADGCLKHPCGIDTCADTLTWKDLKDETKICKDVKKCDGRNNGFDSWCPKSTAIKRCAADTACKGIYDISKNQNRWKICTTNKTKPAGERGHGVMLLTRTPWEAPKICCRAMTASCLSCSAGLTVAKYCEKNSSTVGCPTKCSHTTCTFKELPHKIGEQAVTVMQVTHNNKESKCSRHETIAKNQNAQAQWSFHGAQAHCAKVNDKTRADYGECACHKLGFHPNGNPVNNAAGSVAGNAVHTTGNVDLAKYKALSAGFQAGGAGKAFAGDTSTKGLFYYKNGKFKHMAFFGTGGTAAQENAPLSGNKARISIGETDYNAAAASAQPNAYTVTANTRDGTDYAAHDGHSRATLKRHSV